MYRKLLLQQRDISLQECNDYFIGLDRDSQLKAIVAVSDMLLDAIQTSLGESVEVPKNKVLRAVQPLSKKESVQITFSVVPLLARLILGYKNAEQQEDLDN